MDTKLILHKASLESGGFLSLETFEAEKKGPYVTAIENGRAVILYPRKGGFDYCEPTSGWGYSQEQALGQLEENLQNEERRAATALKNAVERHADAKAKIAILKGDTPGVFRVEPLQWDGDPCIAEYRLGHSRRLWQDGVPGDWHNWGGWSVREGLTYEEAVAKLNEECK